MLGRFLIAFALCCTVATVALAAEPKVPPPPQPLPIGESHAPKSTPSESISKLEHLRMAAEHLEAAGLSDAAKNVRNEAQKLHDETTKQLAELTKQIAELQKKAAELRRLTGKYEQVSFHCRFLELPTELANEFASLEWTSLGGELTQPAFAISKEAEQIFERLRASGEIKILAEPKLVTKSGRPANILSGGEFPILIPQPTGEVSTEWREFGVRCEVLPQVLDSGRIRLDFQPEISQRDFSNAVNLNGSLVPGLTTRRVNMQVEMNFGQTLIVGWLRDPIQLTAGENKEKRDTATLFMVTPVPVEN